MNNSEDNQNAKGGKNSIIRDLMNKGLSARKARLIVDRVLDEWKFALWCGEPVEVPGGILQAKIHQGKPRKTLQRLSNVNTGKRSSRLVKYPGRRRVLNFTPDEKVDLPMPPPLPPPEAPKAVPTPPPETPEEIETRQLAAALLGKPVDRAIIAILQHATEINPDGTPVSSPKSGALLRRLRDMSARGWTFPDVASLERAVTNYYWL